MSAWAKANVLLAVLWADRCVRVVRAEVKVQSEHVYSMVSARLCQWIKPAACRQRWKQSLSKYQHSFFQHASTWILQLSHPNCIVQWFYFKQKLQLLGQAPTGTLGGTEQMKTTLSLKPVHFLCGNIDLEMNHIQCVATEQNRTTSPACERPKSLMTWLNKKTFTKFVSSTWWNRCVNLWTHARVIANLQCMLGRRKAVWATTRGEQVTDIHHK